MIELDSEEKCKELADRWGAPAARALLQVVAADLGDMRRTSVSVLAVDGPADARAPVASGGRRWPPLVGPDGLLGEGGGLDPVGRWSLMVLEVPAGSAALLSRGGGEPLLVLWPAETTLGTERCALIGREILRAGGRIEGPGPGAAAAGLSGAFFVPAGG